MTGADHDDRMRRQRPAADRDDPPRRDRPRPVAFVLVSALLVLSGIVFSQPEFREGADRGAHEAAEADAALLAQQVAAETARLHAQVEQAAKRFLVPFLRYEVGDIDSRVRRELHATATRQFATALLAVPPRAPAGGAFPPQARLQSLDVTFSEAGAFRAFVDAAALRGGTLEKFSFEFEYSENGWRASGVTA